MFDVNERIKHIKFGEGIILDSFGDMITVKFNNRIKKLSKTVASNFLSRFGEYNIYDSETKQWYNNAGYDEDEYNRTGFNREGIGREGYNEKGYNNQGFNRNGIHIKTHTRYNELGYVKDGKHISDDYLIYLESSILDECEIPRAYSQNQSN